MRVFGPAIVAIVVVIAGCGPAHTTPSLVAPTGDYRCKILEDGYQYRPYRCVVRPDGNRTILEKVEGAVRFRGVVASTPAGFTFHGEVYCAEGDCSESVQAEFRPRGRAYVANFHERRGGPAMTVTLEPVVAGATGSADGDGGVDYGGYGYGGTSPY